MRGSENTTTVQASRRFVKLHFWEYSYESTHGYSSTPSGLVMELNCLLWSKVEKKSVGCEGPSHGAGRVVIRLIFPLAEQLTASASNVPAQDSVHGEPKGYSGCFLVKRPSPKAAKSLHSVANTKREKMKSSPFTVASSFSSSGHRTTVLVFLADFPLSGGARLGPAFWAKSTPRQPEWPRGSPDRRS